MRAAEAQRWAAAVNAMRRIIITVVILFIAVGVIGGGGLAYSFLCKGPSLQITGDSHKKAVFATFFGEYCDSLSNVTLTDLKTNVVVWNVNIKPDVSPETNGQHRSRYSSKERYRPEWQH